MTGIHEPFTDDGVTYCGWDGHHGCGETWPCSTIRLAERDASIRAAKAKVAALPDEQRSALEAEFQYAEREALNILRANRQITVDPHPDEQALADILWDTNAESMGWIDCFKNARAIISAGWTPPAVAEHDS